MKNHEKDGNVREEKFDFNNQDVCTFDGIGVHLERMRMNVAVSMDPKLWRFANDGTLDSITVIR